MMADKKQTRPIVIKVFETCTGEVILTCLISDKPCHIARPLLQNKMCGFRLGYALKIFNLIKLKMADYCP